MKIPILLLTNDRAYFLDKVLNRILKFTDWNKFELWILDNKSTNSNKKIINIYKENNKHIKIYSSRINQISLIQNEVISKLKSDIYIKMDDDILVTENWTDAFLNVFERNREKMSFGSVVIPINGFGWIPFLEIMGYIDDFKDNFPNVELKQGCTNVAVWNNDYVCEYIWKKSIDIDSTANEFKNKQNNSYSDLLCTNRYSIGAIIFSHKLWENMGGWNLPENFNKKIFVNKVLQRLIKLRYGNKRKNRLEYISDYISGLTISDLGFEEQQIFDYSIKNELKIPVTTEGIVFHFSFSPTEQHLLNKFYLSLP